MTRPHLSLSAHRPGPYSPRLGSRALAAATAAILIGGALTATAGSATASTLLPEEVPVETGVSERGEAASLGASDPSGADSDATPALPAPATTAYPSPEPVPPADPAASSPPAAPPHPGAAPTDASAAGAALETDFVFAVGDRPGTAVLVDYVGEVPDVVVPSQAVVAGDTLSVTEIGAEAFAAYDPDDVPVTSVMLPESLVTIGFRAFDSNLLAELVIPDSVVTIAAEAFVGNPLSHVTLGSSVASIGRTAFEHFDWATFELVPLEVVFTGAPPAAFSAGEPTTFAGSFAEPEGVLVSYPAAYDAATFAGGFTRPTWEGYDTERHVVVTFDLGVAGGTVPSARVPEGEPVVPPTPADPYGFAFQGWYDDPARTQPHDATAPVSDDTTLYADWDLLERLEWTEIDGVGYYVDLHAPHAGAVVGGTGFSAMRGHLDIPREVEIAGAVYPVTRIDDFAFQCDGLTGVTIPDTVVSIGEGAFQGWPADEAPLPGYCSRQPMDLGNLVIPDSVAEIGDYAFSLSGARTVRVGAGLRHIPEGLFTDVPLATVDLPEGLQSIGAYAFFGGGFSQVRIPSSVRTIGENAFREGALERVTFTGTVLERIAWGAFQGNRLTTVSIPDGVTSIDDAAFADNPLVELRLGATVVSIGRRAFDAGRDDPARTSMRIAAAAILPLAAPAGLVVTFSGPPPPTFAPAGAAGSFGPADGVLLRYPIAFDAAVFPGGYTRPTFGGYATAALAAVTFDLGGRGSVVDPIEVVVGEPIGALPAPTAPGWTFGGWFQDAARASLFPAAEPVTGDMTLYAAWVAAPTPSPAAGVSAPAHNAITLARSGSELDAAAVGAGGIGLLAIGLVLVVARRRRRHGTA